MYEDDRLVMDACCNQYHQVTVLLPTTLTDLPFGCLDSWQVCFWSHAHAQQGCPAMIDPAKASNDETASVVVGRFSCLENGKCGGRASFHSLATCSRGESRGVLLQAFFAHNERTQAVVTDILGRLLW